MTGPPPYTSQSESEPPVSRVQSRDEVDADKKVDTQTSSEEYTLSSSSRARTRAPLAYSPFMKLMEITANINIE